VLTNQSHVSCIISVNSNVGLFINTNNTSQALEFINSSFESSMISFSYPKDQQSILDIHVYFYDPVDIWLENCLKENSLLNKILCFVLLGINVHNKFNFPFKLVIFVFSFFLLMFDMYICTSIKEFE
jgi:hypothetical protein